MIPVKKTIAEINARIGAGRSVVLTAEEVTRLAETTSPREIARKVDVVTTGTFAPMCSSGAFLNFGHADPPIRMERITLNDVPAYAGLAAVDTYIGATETASGNLHYGGAHVIESLVRGEDVRLKASAKGTDCYPRREIETTINKININEAYMFNPRNAYQNYPAVMNTSSKTLHTYMGVLLPKLGNINYSTSGELSPLLNDPELRTIGIGTRVFLCGAQGYVAWQGTQFCTGNPRNPAGIPSRNSATLALIANLKEMNLDFIKAAYFTGYGVSLFVGIGIPIPVLDEEMARFVSVGNRDIETEIFDFGTPGHPSIGRTNYAALQSGEIVFRRKKIRTASMSSLLKARQIAGILKQWIERGVFLLTEPVSTFAPNPALQRLEIRGTQ
jgi:uncharacterized protein (DUF39 family)